MKHAILAIVLVIVLLFLSGNGERQAFAAAPTVNSAGPARIVPAAETSSITAYGYVDAVAKITLKALVSSPAPSEIPVDDHGMMSKIVVAIIALMIVVGGVYYLLLKK